MLRTVGPAATAQAFVERVGVRPARGRKRLRELAAPGLADVETVQNGQGRTKLYTAGTAK